MKKSDTQKKNRDLRLTIIGIVICVLLAPILITNVALIINGYVTGGVPTIAGIVPQIVLSPSMEPEILTGDLIICNVVTADQVKVGDVISFYDPSSAEKTMVVTHKVYSIIENADGTVSFRTYGINNGTPENPTLDPDACPGENVIGIYNGTRFKGLGNVAIFLQSVPGLIVCIGVPIALFVGIDILRRNKYYKATQTDNDELLAEINALRAEIEAKENAEQPQDQNEE